MLSDEQIRRISFLYRNGLALDSIAEREGVTRRLVHWAIDEDKRRARAAS